MLDIGEITAQSGDNTTFAHVVAARGKVRTTIHHESPRGLSGDSFDVSPEQAATLARFYAIASFAAEADERQLNLFGAP
jgi:hypothetical protein